MYKSLKRLLSLIAYNGIIISLIYMASGPSSLINYAALAAICGCPIIGAKEEKIEIKPNIWLSILCIGLALYYNLPRTLSSMLTTYFLFPQKIAIFLGLLSIKTILVCVCRDHDYYIKYGLWCMVILKDKSKQTYLIILFQAALNLLSFTFGMSIPYTHAAILYLTNIILTKSTRDFLIELIATTSHRCSDEDQNIQDVIAHSIDIITSLPLVWFFGLFMVRSTPSIHILPKVGLAALSLANTIKHHCFFDDIPKLINTIHNDLKEAEKILDRIARDTSK